MDWVTPYGVHQLQMARELVMGGSDIDTRLDWEYLIVIFIRENDVEMVKHLINRGCYVNMAMLMQASYLGRKDIVEMLLNAGLPVKGVGNSVIPIVSAAHSGDVATFKLLMERGAKISGRKWQNAVVGALESRNWDMIDLVFS
eukprot:TRINITY_DN3127_c1_g1_i5.p2 TRINITY_DN3127_c1_g1~~TRINITY_DN3127_c1_g1_i5.p2  ORF type:complete len:143 (-),score=40.25 TRINITY_DN3127_c1_g1_i5:667-1095(-)